MVSFDFLMLVNFPVKEINLDTSSFETVIELNSSQNYGLMLSALLILETQRTFLT